MAGASSVDRCFDTIVIQLGAEQLKLRYLWHDDITGHSELIGPYFYTW